MGGDSSSHVWHVRVTITEKNTLAKIQAFCRANTYVKLACMEGADGETAMPHTHIACVSIEKAIVRSTLLSHLRKHLELNGNEDYSATVPKEDQKTEGLYRYICKGTDPDWSIGKPNIIHNLLNLVDVSIQHRDYWNIHKELEAKAKRDYKQITNDGRKVRKAVIAKLTEKFKDEVASHEVLHTIGKAVVNEYKGEIADTPLFVTTQAILWNIDPVETASRAANRMVSRMLGKLF